jgi:hypothetical protein
MADNSDWSSEASQDEADFSALPRLPGFGASNAVAKSAAKASAIPRSRLASPENDASDSDGT